MGKNWELIAKSRKEKQPQKMEKKIGCNKNKRAHKRAEGPGASVGRGNQEADLEARVLNNNQYPRTNQRSPIYQN